MDNVFEQPEVKKTETPVEKNRPLHQSDFPPKVVKNRHIDGILIERGLIADRPSDGTTNIQAYFATDTGVLSIWDGTQWLTTTLT